MPKDRRTTKLAAPRLRGWGEELPLAENFADDLTASATLDLPFDRFSTLRKFGRRHRGSRQDSIVSAAEVPAGKEGLHLYVSLASTSPNQSRLILNAHRHTPVTPDPDLDKVWHLLDGLGHLASQAVFRIGAAFRFPREKFAPIILDDPQHSAALTTIGSATLRLAGIKFISKSGPLESLVIDVSDTAHVFVAPVVLESLEITTRIFQAALEAVKGEARRFVRDNRGTEAHIT